jgi:molybdopterin-guanine dinucleotide biosynthesis protein MobB
VWGRNYISSICPKGKNNSVKFVPKAQKERVKMLPVVSIVGKSGAGKTTLVERLIAEFKKRGCRVVTIKHSRQKIDIDKPGKDSWRFAEAGSDAVVVSSPDKLVLVKSTDHDSGIDEILHIIGSEFGLVLVEGFKRGKAPKIEVHRRELGEDLVCPPEILSAIATDEPLDIDMPQFSLNDTQAIADFIEKSFVSQAKGDTLLFVNGKQVFVKLFVKEVFAKVNLALVSTLKGVEKIKSLDISIRNKADK